MNYPWTSRQDHAVAVASHKSCGEYFEPDDETRGLILQETKRALFGGVQPRIL